MMMKNSVGIILVGATFVHHTINYGICMGVGDKAKDRLEKDSG